MLILRTIPILQDNYAFLLKCSETGITAIVDPAEETPILKAIEAEGGRLDIILITHHHGDHIAAVEPIQQRFGAKVIGAKADAYRLPHLDQEVVEGDTVAVGNAQATVIDTPGHTIGHIAYDFAEDKILLCGDTLFSLGCGRFLEGTASDMFASLAKLAILSPDTRVCCGHEYTQANAKFSLHADPGNAALVAYAKHVDELRANGQPTIPSRLGDELACNPFLRAPDVASLARLREAKNKF